LDSTKIPFSTFSWEILEGTATTILVVLVALGSSTVAGTVVGVLGGGPDGVVVVGPSVVGRNVCDDGAIDFFLELPLLPFDFFFDELPLLPFDFFFDELPRLLFVLDFDDDDDAVGTLDNCFLVGCWDFNTDDGT